ncbi:MBL fold metallo-hydrolase [Pikeienuella piscinae]|uniref:MBL fold metallo-hydrolase n=1 Tax=Pikeienuella piscinae TaxID=2748098 RepID=UPI001FEAC4F0|nr:MBL fold metallo-hydrolase [Pikeienuella piscinae]
MAHSGGRTVIIDAGLVLDPNLNLPRAGQLIGRLEAAGVDLASVTDVVLTHMHMDHVGGLLVDGVKGRLRPDLRIHVAAAKVKFWEAPDFRSIRADRLSGKSKTNHLVARRQCDHACSTDGEAGGV